MFVILRAVDLLNQVFRVFQWLYSLSRANHNSIKTIFIFHREKYSKYDDNFRFEVAIWAKKHDQRQAEKKYAIPESTARGFFKSYRAQKSLAVKTQALKQGKRGKRTMLPAEIDEKVLEKIRSMRNTAVVINFHIVVGLVTGIVLANDRTLLKEIGVTVEFTVAWCQSIFKTLNFVRRKSTTAKPLITPAR